MGKNIKGQGWRSLKHPVPEQPITWEELIERNRDVVMACASDALDKQADELLKEILKEWSVGRMCGPFKAPVVWNMETVPLPPEWAQQCERANRCGTFQSV